MNLYGACESRVPVALAKTDLENLCDFHVLCFVHHIIDQEAAFCVAVIVVNAVQFYTRNCMVYK